MLRLVNAGELSRSEFVAAVLHFNPSIAAARASLRAARARVRQAGALDDPRLEGSFAPLSIGSSAVRFGFEVAVRQNLPWFGKRSLEQEAMADEATASASDFDMARRELAMTALLLYDQYYVALRSLEINRQHVDLLQSLQVAATSQFEAGRGSAQDALQAEAELTHLERDAVVLESERDVVTAQLNELLHRDPDARLPPPVVELVPHTEPDLRNPTLLEKEAIARRSEISAARSHARAQAAKAEVAEREAYPSFSVATSYSTMWAMPEHRWMVGAGINIPLPNERRAGMIEEAHAARAQYESEVDRMSDMAKTQVHVALRKVQESKQVLQLFQTRLLPVAHDQVDAALAGFIASQTSFTAVVDAEKNLRTTELDQKLAQADCDRRQGELARALGRIPGLDAERGE